MNNNEKKIERILRTRGFIFPETIEEVIEFEKIYGKTEIVLPYALQNPTYLCVQGPDYNPCNKDECVQYGMAAREVTSELPKDIKDKIISDIDKFESEKLNVSKH